MTVNGNTITVVYYIYNQTANTWSAFDTYIYTMTSRNFGANDANQAIDPPILTNYYTGIGLLKIWGGHSYAQPRHEHLLQRHYRVCR